MPSTNRREIAARLRALAGGSRLDLPPLAVQLGVDEAALRASLDELAPRPTLEVLIGAVHYFGVDPAWLLTGEYCCSTHMRCMAAEMEHRDEEIYRLISRLSVHQPHWSAWLFDSGRFENRD